MGAIQLKTELPGPKSQQLTALRAQYVSKGVFTPPLGLFFARGEGCRLVDVDGNVFLDFIGGIGSNNCGHSPQRVLIRAQEQMQALQHTCFMTGPYESYVRLAAKLCQIAPGSGEKKAAFFNSGAEAVENAIKIARKATGRTGVLAFDPGFHGRTLLAMTLTSKVVPYRDGFGPFAPEVYRFPLPDLLRRPAGLTEEQALDASLREFQRFLKSTVKPESLACAIIEPVVGEGGFIVPHARFLEELSKLCEDHGILLIADEVQTGFGRTGKMFACEQLGLRPHLVTLAKSLSNGFPLSAVVGRAEIMDAPQPGGIGGTFGGNPISCAAALGAIETIEQEGLLARAVEIGETVGERFDRFKERFPFVGDARGLGAMRAIEIVRDRDGMEPDKERTGRVIGLCAERGLLLLAAGLYGNVIRTLMPLSISDPELAEGLDVLETCLEESN